MGISENPPLHSTAGAPAANELLPFVYQELRRLACAHMSREKPGQTLQPTALVHEAWLRLQGPSERQWESRTHFFRAAALAMRRILVERARRRLRREALEGGPRVSMDDLELASPMPDEELLRMDELLTQLAAQHPHAAGLVDLRFFAGLGHAEAAEQLGMSRSAADRAWLLARTWLFAHLRMTEPPAAPGAPGGPKT